MGGCLIWSIIYIFFHFNQEETCPTQDYGCSDLIKKPHHLHERCCVPLFPCNAFNLWFCALKKLIKFFQHAGHLTTVTQGKPLTYLDQEINSKYIVAQCHANNYNLCLYEFSIKIIKSHLLITFCRLVYIY